MKLQTDSLQQNLNDQIFENNKLRPHFKGKFSEPQMNHNGTSVNTKLSRPSTSGTKLYSVTLLPKSKVIPKVVKKNDLSKSVTSHLTTNKIIEKCTKVLGPRRVSSTNASGSKPKSNTKNDRIPQLSSRSMKNKVEAHHRKFKSSANKNSHVLDCNANDKNVALSKNSDTIYLSCNEYCRNFSLTGHHDKLINFVSKFIENFGSLFRVDHRLKTLETDFSEFKQTNQFADAVSSIPGIVDAYLANKMHEAIKTVIQLQSERLRDEAQTENADFLNKLNDNIKKKIKDQVKEQVKAQVSKILLKINKTVNEQLEAEVMTRSSTKSKTSLAIATNLSELELKKILIDKMESNKSIHRSDEQKNLYKALVDTYESDKLILDTYGDTISFKRGRDDEDKDKEPSIRSNWGSKRRRARKEPESTNAPKEKTSETSGKSYEASKSQHKTASESAQTDEPMHTTKDLEEPAH
ncbi:hypothetical protein Tco_1079617 [Tanacetum coccineum]|uniref:Uncharacterized protein n=1 Tax=Tanacetum coccineum TaxID=301880 RepID=A0ABQ5HU07_9ASTR